MSEDVENAAILGMIGIGALAITVGIAALRTATTSTISAVGSAVGGGIGGYVGSSAGIVTGGAGIVATVPFAVGGAAIGSWAGPALALVGIGTAPAWALPVAVAGGVCTSAGLAVGGYKYLKRRSNRQAPPDVAGGASA